MGPSGLFTNTNIKWSIGSHIFKRQESWTLTNKELHKDVNKPSFFCIFGVHLCFFVLFQRVNSSTLTYNPTIGDHRKVLTCKAENPDLQNSAIQDSLTLQVHCKFDHFLKAILLLIAKQNTCFSRYLWGVTFLRYIKTHFIELNLDTNLYFSFAICGFFVPDKYAISNSKTTVLSLK